MNRITKLLLLIMLVHVQFLQGQTISKVEYKEKLKGFWLGSCIANWTGLKTEGQRNNKPYLTFLPPKTMWMKMKEIIPRKIELKSPKVYFCQYFSNNF